MADVSTRLERLQENNEQLQRRLTNAEDGLRQSAVDDEISSSIRSLQAKVREQDELIESQEAQIASDKDEKAKLRKEVQANAKATIRLLELEDQVKELKYENVELSKKANTIDRYKQKLEAQKDFTKQNQALQQEFDELQGLWRDCSKDLEHVRQRNESLETTNKQYERAMAAKEVDIFEINLKKTAIENNLIIAEQKIDSLTERLKHDDNYIATLQEQLNSPTSTSTESPRNISNLEDELNVSDSLGRNNLEISRLKAENTLLKGNAGVAQENSLLRAQLESAESNHKALEAKYRDIYAKQVVVEQQMTAMMNKATGSGLVEFVNVAMSIGSFNMLTPEYHRTEAFIELRNAHARAEQDIVTLRNKNAALEEELENAKRELFTAQSDCKHF
jgi:protein HOOK3